MNVHGVERIWEKRPDPKGQSPMGYVRSVLKRFLNNLTKQKKESKMIKFRSIKNDQIGYAWGWESGLSNRGSISWDAHQFMTFGDGMVQHSPFGNLEPGNIIDFLYSMAEHLFQNSKEIEEAKSGWGYDEAT